jgi:hypothetical protein
MEWKVMIEGRDEHGEVQRAQLRIEKGFERLKCGEIGLSIDDGKRIMKMLQELVVKQELATYALARRVCPECNRFRPVKDYTSPYWPLGSSRELRQNAWRGRQTMKSHDTTKDLDIRSALHAKRLSSEHP